MTHDETPHERRSRLLHAQTRLKEERQWIITNRLLCVIAVLTLVLTLILLRRYGVL